MDREKLEKLNFLADVAEAVLVEGLTQLQAAERFGLSRPTISRLLSEARENGLVKVEIVRAEPECQEYSKRLVEQLGVANAYVANGTKQPAGLDHGAFAKFSADKVAAKLTAGTMLGVTLGTTIGSLIEQLAKHSPTEISVVQLCGSVGGTDPLLDSHALVSRLGHAFGVNCLHFHAPYAVETRDMRDMLNANPSNRLCLEQARNVDVALVGIGSMGPARSSLHQGGHIAAEALEQFRQNGAVGDVGGYYIDTLGGLAKADGTHFWRTGVSAADFQKIPTRIGVALGGHKVDAILASIRGGWVTDLITDQMTAENLLNS